MEKKLAMVAFGGNALLRAGQKGTFREQLENVERTCENLLPLLKRGYDLVIGHGNGPQVGNGLGRFSAWRRCPWIFAGRKRKGRLRT